MNLTGSGVLAAGAVVVVAVLGVLAWRNRELFNPASDRNVVNQAASGAVAAITGGAAAGGEDSVGGLAARVREWWSGDDAAIEAMKRGAPPVQPDGSIASVADYESGFFMGAP